MGKFTHEIIMAIQLLQSLFRRIQNHFQSISTLSLSSSSSSYRSNSFIINNRNQNQNENKNENIKLENNKNIRKSQQVQNFPLRLPPDICMWMNGIARRTPVFVINLDRRPDRLVC